MRVRKWTSNVPGLGVTILRTGDVQRYIGVSSRTVAKLIDRGDLKGYRIGADRRVTRAALIEFMVTQGIPLPPELAIPEYLAVGLDSADAARLPGLSPVGRFHAAALAATGVLGGAVIGDLDGLSAAVELATWLANRHPAAVVVLLVAESVGEVPGWSGDIVHRPCSSWELLARVVRGGS